MTNTHLYLPTVLPQWGIFAGIVLITIGYVDKKDIWTRLGWIVLIVTSLAALYFNLFGELNTVAEKDPGSVASLLISAGWQTVTGGVLAVASLIMLQLKKKRYAILAILTIVYFILIFFQYYQASVLSGKGAKAVPTTEQKQ